MLHAHEHEHENRGHSTMRIFIELELPCCVIAAAAQPFEALPAVGITLIQKDALRPFNLKELPTRSPLPPRRRRQKRTESNVENVSDE